MENLVALLQSVEGHLTAAEKELEEAEPKASEADKTLRRCAELAQKAAILQASLFVQEIKLVEGLHKVLCAIDITFMDPTNCRWVVWIGFKDSKPNILFRLRDPYCQHRFNSMERFTKYMANCGFLWEFCQEAERRIREHLSKAGDAQVQNTAHYSKTLNQLCQLRDLAKA